MKTQKFKKSLRSATEVEEKHGSIHYIIWQNAISGVMKLQQSSVCYLSLMLLLFLRFKAN